MSRKIQNFLDQFRLVFLCDSQLIKLQSLVQPVQLILHSAVLLSALPFYRPGNNHNCRSAVICHCPFTHAEDTAVFLIQHFLGQITAVFLFLHTVTGNFSHISCKYLTVFTSKIIINTGQLLCRRIHKIYFLAFRIHQIHDLLQLIQNFAVLKLFCDCSLTCMLFMLSFLFIILCQAPDQLHISIVRNQTGILKLLCRHRSAKKEALDQLREERIQTMKLLLVLYALTADPNPGAVGQLQHIAEQPVIISALLDLTDKAAVNLNLIHLQTLQIAQGRISGSKIINRNMNFLITPIREYIIKIIIILQLHALRNFHCDISARKPCLSGCFHHIIYNRSLSQLHIGSIDTDAEILLQLPPSGALGKCLLHHPLTYRNDHTALLQNRDKHNRRHKTKFPGTIAQQCLCTVKLIFIGGYLGLIIKLKALKIVLDTVPHLLLKLNPGQGLVIILRREILYTVPASLLGTAQGIIRIADQYIYIFFLFKRIADNSC